MTCGAIASSALAFSGTSRPCDTAVGGDDDRALGVVDAVGQRIGAEPAEDDRVRRPMRVQASIATGSSGIIGM